MSLKSGYGKSTDPNTSIELSQNESLLNKITQILEIVLEENESISHDYSKKMPLSSYNIPSISIKDYLLRIQNYTEAEESTFIIALMYINRLNKIGKIYLTPYNIHRIVFVAILLAIKYNEDLQYDFNFYSMIAGIPMKELKYLESEFTCLIKFNLYINDEDYRDYKSYLDDIDCDDEDIKK